MGLVETIQSTGRPLFLLVGLGLGGAYYFTNMEVLESKDMQIEQQKAALEKSNEDIREAEKVAGDKVKFEEEVNRVSSQLQAALEFLPNKLNEQEVLSKISSEARVAGVNPTSITPKMPMKADFYEELLMEVQMEGSYTQLVTFLANISKIERIVNIRGLELELKNFNGQIPILKMKGTLVAYRYVEADTKQGKAP